MDSVWRVRPERPRSGRQTKCSWAAGRVGAALANDLRATYPRARAPEVKVSYPLLQTLDRPIDPGELVLPLLASAAVHRMSARS